MSFFNTFMLFSEYKKTLSDYIIELLDKGPLSGAELVARILNTTNTSKESIYRVLRQLLKQEVINKAHKKYSLNRHWIQHMHAFSLRHTQNIHAFDAHGVMEFEDGDSITYQFKNPDLMGIYWGHLGDYVLDKYSGENLLPLYVYHPHEWLIHARTKSETHFLERLSRDKRTTFFSIGGKTQLDKQFKKDWSNQYRKININVKISGLKPNRYINVIGDFIFEVRTTVAFEQAIDDFFNQQKTINKNNQQGLKKIVHDKYQTKLIFSRNKKRANKLRRQLSKDFYIFS